MKYALTLILFMSGQAAFGQLITVEPRVSSPYLTIGQTLDVNVFVSDERDVAEGILSVFLDLEYDAAMFDLVADSLTFGPGFAALQKFDTSKPGTVDETGAFVSGILSLPPVPSGVGGQPELLYSFSLQALAVGDTEILTNHADILPLNSTTLLGIDDGISETDINYGSAQVTIVPEPANQSLLLLTVASLFTMRRKTQQPK